MTRNTMFTSIAICVALAVSGIGIAAYAFGTAENTTANQANNNQAQWGNIPNGNGQGNFNFEVPNEQGNINDETPNEQDNSSEETPPEQSNMPSGIGMDLSQFVDDGTIDQATADKMQEYMQSQNPQNGGQFGQGMNQFIDFNMFSEMVSNGILTQEQADKIQESMPQMGNGNMPSNLPTGFGNR